MKDINGVEIVLGQKVKVIPAGDIRTIEENPKHWIDGLVIASGAGYHALNEHRAKKLEVI